VLAETANRSTDQRIKADFPEPEDQARIIEFLRELTPSVLRILQLLEPFESMSKAVITSLEAGFKRRYSTTNNLLDSWEKVLISMQDVSSILNCQQRSPTLSHLKPTASWRQPPPGSKPGRKIGTMSRWHYDHAKEGGHCVQFWTTGSCRRKNCRWMSTHGKCGFVTNDKVCCKTLDSNNECPNTAHHLPWN